MGLRERKLPWISEEVLTITDQRREIRAKMRKDVTFKVTYNKLTREIRNDLNKCRNEWIERQCHELETANLQNGTRKLFGKLK